MNKKVKHFNVLDEVVDVCDYTLHDSYIFANEYGVSEDNVDNTQYFQNAVDACIATGKTLIIPHGIYDCLNQITVNLDPENGKDRFSVKGNSCIIRTKGANGLYIVANSFDAYNNAKVNVNIEDINFSAAEGQAYSLYSGICFGIPQMGVMTGERDFITLNRVNVRFYAHALYFTNVRHVMVNNCIFNDISDRAIVMKNDGRTAFHGNNSFTGDMMFNNCEFECYMLVDFVYENFGGNVECNFNGVHFNHCYFYSNVRVNPSLTFVRLETGTIAHIKDWWFDGCQFDQIHSGACFTITKSLGTVSGLVGDIHVVNCYFECHGIVFSINYADKIWILGNYVRSTGANSGQHGCLHSSDSTSQFVLDNYIQSPYDSVIVRGSYVCTNNIGTITFDNTPA